MSYDKDNMSADLIQKLVPLYEDPAFTPDAMSKQSFAVVLCKWIRAMVLYDRVAKDIKRGREAVAPMRRKLAAADEAAEDARQGVNSLTQEIAELTTRLSELEELQTEKTRQLNELQKMKGN